MPLDPTHRIFRPQRRARVPGLRFAMAVLLFALPSLHNPASSIDTGVTSLPKPVSTVGWANPLLLVGPGH
jgi:hypothetical protein